MIPGQTLRMRMRLSRSGSGQIEKPFILSKGIDVGSYDLLLRLKAGGDPRRGIWSQDEV